VDGARDRLRAHRWPPSILPRVADPSASHPFDGVTEAALRRRQSAKWRLYPPDVLPSWIAEMDFPLAAPIAQAVKRAIDDDDAGYAFAGGLGEAFASWADARWGWRVAPADVHLVADVVTGIAALLRAGTPPGAGVLIEPPVYAPFAATIRATGRTVVEAPLVRVPARVHGNDCGWVPDLAAIERAYASGVRAHILCNPQNPTGLVYGREALAAIARLAAKHGVVVLSDEIHAPLTLPGAVHHPFPTVSDEAAETVVVLTSASKAWNVAGLKAAMMVAASDATRALLAKLPLDTPFHAGHLGVVAARAAFEEGNPWLSSALIAIDRNRSLLEELLRAELPRVRYVPPRAGYLAWLDCTDLGLGDDPASAFLERGRVALSSGPSFGVEGKGFARMNIATTRTLLEDAVRRMRRAL
jgi:cystathionine beta-lyase